MVKSDQKLRLGGDFTTFTRILVPLLLFLFCESLTGFVERIFLSYHSAEAVSSSLAGTYLAFIFNNPCIVIASMAQVFVGLYHGSGELRRIGSCVWQLIWFSILSLIITLPLGLWSSSFYFKGTQIELMGKEYFTILALGNFLFPLNTALTSFYLGRGKTKVVTLTMLGAYAIHLILSKVAISGIEGIIPAMGARGAALAKCLSLALSNGVLLCLFLAKKNREIYKTDAWQFSASSLWNYIRPGLVRAFGFFWVRLGWAVTSYMMIKKGGLYLDVLSIGGTVIAFLIFIPTAVYRTVLSIVPNLLGAKNYSEVWRLCRTLLLSTVVIAVIVAIPLILFPQTLIYFFDFSSYCLFEERFGMINHWVWLYIVAFTVQTGLSGFITAARDLKIQFYGYLLSYLDSLVPVYLMIYKDRWNPDKLWLIMAIESIIFACLFFYRLSQKKWAYEQSIPA